MNAMLELSAKAAPVDYKRAKEIFRDSQTMFYQKVRGIKEQIEKGRYHQYAIMESGKLLVNYFVYYDYSTYRTMLEDRNAAKYVPKFEPLEIAKITPVMLVHEY